MKAGTGTLFPVMPGAAHAGVRADDVQTERGPERRTEEQHRMSATPTLDIASVDQVAVRTQRVTGRG